MNLHITDIHIQLYFSCIYAPLELMIGHSLTLFFHEYTITTMDVQMYSKLYSSLEEVYKLVLKGKKREEIENWLKFIRKQLRLIKKLLKNATTNGEKMKFTTIVSRLRGFEEKFKELNIITGGGGCK